MSFLVLLVGYIMNHFLPGLYNFYFQYYQDHLPQNVLFRFAFMVPCAVGLIWWIATVIKKRRQAGELWSGRASARVELDNQTLTCPHCENDQFYKREALLATSWVRLFRFPMFNQSCCCFVCTNCAFIRWFTRKESKATFSPDLRLSTEAAS